MKRIALIIAYDGSAYAGFQIQKNAVTIEQVLNDCLSAFLKEEIHIIGASRTDAGVHALGNVAVFDTNTRIPPEKIAFALNTCLPEDIRIQRPCEVPANFHPRHQNSKKTYEYRILNTKIPNPLLRKDTFFYYRPLDTEKMQAAAQYLLGEHDFQAFCSAHAQVNDTVRTLYEIQVERDGDLVRIRICGNGFLYNMVRIIAGSLLRVGTSDKQPEWIREVLLSKDRAQAGDCAPAAGLTLLEITYEPLPDALFVQNEEIVYYLWQKEIREKQKAYLTVLSCDEGLKENISRLTLKSFRYGAKWFYVRYEGEDLAALCGASRHNTYREKPFFTAGDYRYVLYGDVIQMDRDLRADPPLETAQKVSLVPCGPEADETFLQLYRQCFFSTACAVTLTGEDLIQYRQQQKTPYLLVAEDKAVGILLLETQEEAIEIGAIGIAGRSRRKGYGKETIELVAAAALAAGKKRVTLQVFENNKKAVQLYLHTGFYRIRSRERWYVCTDVKKRAENVPDASKMNENKC